MEEIKVDFEEYTKQVIDETRKQDGSVVATVAVPLCKLHDRSVEPFISVKASNSNPITIALAICELEKVIEELKNYSDDVELALEVVKESFENARQITVNFNEEDKDDTTNDTEGESR